MLNIEESKGVHKIEFERIVVGIILLLFGGIVLINSGILLIIFRDILALIMTIVGLVFTFLGIYVLVMKNQLIIDTKNKVIKYKSRVIPFKDIDYIEYRVETLLPGVNVGKTERGNDISLTLGWAICTLSIVFKNKERLVLFPFITEKSTIMASNVSYSGDKLKIIDYIEEKTELPVKKIKVMGGKKTKLK